MPAGDPDGYNDPLAGVPPQLIDALLQQFQLPPEWSISQQAFQPYDSDYYADQVNYQQDLMRNAMDPAFAFLNPAGFNPQALEPTEDVTPATTEGRDFLTAIANSGENSPRKYIAQRLLQGVDPETAIQELVDDEKLQLFEEDGRSETAQAKSLRSFATSGFDRLYSDQPEQRTQVPNENLQKLQGLGFTDPRQAYTPEFVNPALPAIQQQAASDSAVSTAMFDKLKAMRQQQPTPLTRSQDFSKVRPDNLGIISSNPQANRPAFLDKIEATQPSGAETRRRREADPMRQSAIVAGDRAAGSGIQSKIQGLQAAAAAQHLQNQGRRPFLDEMATRLGIRL